MKFGDLAGRGPLGQKAPMPKGDGKAHMAKVARLPCVICGARPVEVHHVICGRYGQRRASDFDTIPLCVEHHRIGPDAIHNGKASWVERWGPDTDYLPAVRQAINGGENE